MSLLKWLFQPAYILLIIVLVALYVNRAVVFPEEVAESLEAEALVAKAEGLIEQLRSEADHPAAVETQDAGTAKAESTVALAAAPGLAEGGDTFEDKVDALEMQPVVPAAEEVAQPPVTAETADTTESGADVAAVVQSVDGEPLQSVAPDFEDKGVVDTLPVVPSSDEVSPPQTEAPSFPLAEGLPDTAAEVAAAPSEDVEAVGAEPLVVWRDARAAVWQGDLDTAVQRYRALIALQPDNYDAHGELGNVLLAQNKVAAAMEAYTAAARLIHHAGHIRMAYRVAGVVASLDEAQGRALFDEFSQR